jgi:tetratricopeptide (TPR) repeat protein
MNTTLDVESETRLSGVSQELAEARTLGDAARVQKILRSARRMKPRSIDDEMTLGFVNLELGDFRAALGWFTHVAELRPRLSMAHSGRALTLQLLKDPVQALDATRTALELDPRDIVALKVLVRIDLDMNLPEDARGICRKILAINPGDPDATAMLGLAAYPAGRMR